jgi:hypothetical protein
VTLDTGIVIGDFSRGNAEWGLLEHGSITAVEVPHGTAYLASNHESQSVDFGFSTPVTKIGAFVTGTAGSSIQLQIFDSSGTLLETASQSSVVAQQWGSNFLGIAHSTGISKARWTGSFLTLDKLLFEGGTITPLPTLSIAGTSQPERNSGTTPHTFTVNLSGSSQYPVTVNYATANGTAIAGSDYTASSGTLTFLPGETSNTITVNTFSDNDYEPDETLTLSLSNPTGATISTATATGTILNDDQRPTMQISSVTQIEANKNTLSIFSFIVSLSHANDTETITVNYTTANGTAIAGSDYTASSGTLTFLPGETSKAIAVNVTGDRLFEPNETFTVTLSNAINASITTATATGTITNDDINPNTDFNGDGKPDLLWQNLATGENLVWFMNGSTLTSWTLLLPATPASWSPRGTGDFNGDGHTDIVWRNLSTGENLVWFMNGSTYSSFTTLTAVADNWQIADVADFNGDAKPDLLWRHQGTGENLVWFMNGTAIASWTGLPTVADLNWQIGTTADLNGDGHTDIVWRHYGTGDTLIWLMNGSTYSTYVSLPTPHVSWKLEGSGDFNQDGEIDLVWRNYSTGENLVWLMNGTTYSTYTLLTAVGDLNWQSYS